MPVLPLVLHLSFRRRLVDWQGLNGRGLGPGDPHGSVMSAERQVAPGVEEVAAIDRRIRLELVPCHWGTL